MNDEKWKAKHDTYSKEDWVNKPSIFSEQVIQYFPIDGRVLELGAGHGQDGNYFSSQGFEVTSTDLETSSLEKNTQQAGVRIAVQKLDLCQPFPFKNDSFDVVYAHLALHYFNSQTTDQIFEEIYRVLKPNGIVAFLVNSTSDPEYDTGTKLEDGLFAIEGSPKRFFTTDNASSFARKFSPILADNDGETYKDMAKGVHHLVRFVGRKNA